jgi:hypothetical protein
MAETKEKNYRLNVALTVQQKNGVTITVSTECSNWELVQKFLSDFQNTLLKGNDGKT